MNQMIKKLVNDVSEVGSCYADLVNCVSYIDSKHGAAIMAAAPYVILGSIFIYMYVKRCWGSKRGPVTRDMGSKTGRALTRSMSLAELHGGVLAWQRFLSYCEDYNGAQANPKTLENVEHLLDALLKQEHLDFKYLQNTVAKLEMSAREDTVIELLKRAEKAHENKPHEAYEIEMLIVEMLIYKRDYDEANHCKCLNDEHEHISDARRPFYKAILHIARGRPEEEEEAKNYWKEFMDTRRQFMDIIKPPPFVQNQAFDSIIDFPQFKEKVRQLLSDISLVAKKKAKIRHVLKRSISLGELHGGDLAFQRFLSYRVAQVNPKTLENVEFLLDALLKQEHLDFKYLQNIVAKLEMSAKEDIAIELLKRAKKALENKPHEAYEIEMLIVEMLIYKGDYRGADEGCECLKDEHEHISDARLPFYKAILHIALCEPEEKAKNCWEEFVDIRRQFRDIIKPPPSPLQNEAYDTIIDFSQFKEKVQQLISYISHVVDKDAKK